MLSKQKDQLIMHKYCIYSSTTKYCVLCPPVFAYEPHSTVGLGVVALSNFSGLLPFKKVKVMGASAVSLFLVSTHFSAVPLIN